MSECEKHIQSNRHNPGCTHEIFLCSGGVPLDRRLLLKHRNARKAITERLAIHKEIEIPTIVPVDSIPDVEFGLEAGVEAGVALGKSLLDAETVYTA